MPRYLAKVESRLGVLFPDSFVAGLKAGAVSRCRLGELWTPDEYAWLDDQGYEVTAKTLLMIGMHHRGDARPMVMRRASGSANTLDDAILVYRGPDRVEPVAASLPTLIAPPEKPPSNSPTSCSRKTSRSAGADGSLYGGGKARD